MMGAMVTPRPMWKLSSIQRGHRGDLPVGLVTIRPLRCVPPFEKNRSAHGWVLPVAALSRIRSRGPERSVAVTVDPPPSLKPCVLVSGNARPRELKPPCRGIIARGEAGELANGSMTANFFSGQKCARGRIAPDREHGNACTRCRATERWAMAGLVTDEFGGFQIPPANLAPRGGGRTLMTTKN